MSNAEHVAALPQQSKEPLCLLVENLGNRLEKLEQTAQRSPLKRITENAGAVALFLGLVLTVASLYDVFVTKPQADRVEVIGKFNQAVNSAAQVRQELLVLQMQTTNPMLQITAGSMATPRILNNISTARALLPNLEDADIGIPQLIILISESFTAGDLASAGYFVSRAMQKKDVSPYLRSEAMRYQGRFLFLSGRPTEGRAAYEDAATQLGTSPMSAAPRAYVLGDLVAVEFALGDCAKVEPVLQRLQVLLDGPGIALDARKQIATSVRAQLEQMRDRHCAMPSRAAELLTPTSDQLEGPG